jgi:hypothetical protein
MTNKYCAVKTEVDNIVFHSKREANRYSELKLLVRAGIIHDLELQVWFPLVVNNVKIATYLADFAYRDIDDRVVVEDSKGIRTPVYKLKAKLMLACHNIRILET